MPQQNINNKKENLDIKKVFDFTKTLFASILRSRKGALVELARLSRFQKGTKGYERQYERLLPLIQELKIAFWDSVKENLPKYGLCLGIFDDSSIKKTGKLFPKQQVHHDHCSGSFYTGLKVFSSLIYQAGKTATIQSEIVGKEDNKLDVAKQHFDKLISYFAVDVFLFDSWYCKHPLISYIQEKKKNFISRIRCDSTVLGMEEKRIDKIVKHTSHKEYEHIKIHGKSYWIKEFSWYFVVSIAFEFFIAKYFYCFLCFLWMYFNIYAVSCGVCHCLKSELFSIKIKTFLQRQFWTFSFGFEFSPFFYKKLHEILF